MIYLTNLLVSFHYFIIVYINSAFLSEYVDARDLSLLYIAGSVSSIVIFILFGRIVRRIGNYRLMILFSFFEIAALSGLAFGQGAAIVIASFLAYLAVSPAIYLNLDIFLERLTRNERMTGGIRGMFLTMQNIAQVACPLLLGFLLPGTDYRLLYLISIGFLCAGLALVMARLRRFDDAEYRPRTPWRSALYVFRHPFLYDAFAAQFLLRFFYAWMVIYTPLYLYKDLGFSWPEIGIMFSIMLMPFLLLELPLGRAADSRFGERDMMISGFALMAVAVLSMPFLPPSFAFWAAILFVSRVGAACVEMATESYFFRHVDGSRADMIGLFRMARPVTYIAAAGVAAASFGFLSLQWSFLVLAAAMAWGLTYAFALRDAR